MNMYYINGKAVGAAVRTASLTNITTEIIPLLPIFTVRTCRATRAVTL